MNVVIKLESSELVTQIGKLKELLRSRLCELIPKHLFDHDRLTADLVFTGGGSKTLPDGTVEIVQIVRLGKSFNDARAILN